MNIERLNKLKGITEQLYQDGYIPLTYCDKTLELIDAEIARQSVTDEEITNAVDWFSRLKSGDWPFKSHDRFLELAITALQEYQLWVSVEERLPEEKDADENGYVLVLFSDGAVESWSIEEIDDWNTDELRVVGDFGCIVFWRPMLPEPPKGE